MTDRRTNGMSDFNTTVVLMALVLANMSFHFFMDRLIRDRADAVVTGVIRGVAVPSKHRWLVLQNSWLPAVAALIIFECSLAGVGALRK
jgi:hypothetical protein